MLLCVQEVVTPFYIVTYYIKWVTTSWTYSRYILGKFNCKLSNSCCYQRRVSDRCPSYGLFLFSMHFLHQVGWQLFWQQSTHAKQQKGIPTNRTNNETNDHPIEIRLVKKSYFSSSSCRMLFYLDRMNGPEFQSAIINSKKYFALGTTQGLAVSSPGKYTPLEQWCGSALVECGYGSTKFGQCGSGSRTIKSLIWFQTIF